MTSAHSHLCVDLTPQIHMLTYAPRHTHLRGVGRALVGVVLRTFEGSMGFTWLPVLSVPWALLAIFRVPSQARLSWLAPQVKSTQCCSFALLGFVCFIFDKPAEASPGAVGCLGTVLAEMSYGS